MRWLDSITDSMDMDVNKLRETEKDRKPGGLWSRGSQRVRHDWATERQQKWLWVALAWTAVHTKAFHPCPLFRVDTLTAQLLRRLGAGDSQLSSPWELPSTTGICRIQNLGSSRGKTYGQWLAHEGEQRSGPHASIWDNTEGHPSSRASCHISWGPKATEIQVSVSLSPALSSPWPYRSLSWIQLEQTFCMKICLKVYFQVPNLR